ncbi:ABC transporter permease [Nocardioides panacisoli]|uniref:ABC transporter permease n=1 Tax=Nocardioides panacisoli TaxID=627624 RepID=UPI001C639744|nr:ABC transporter permease [Nocardioides panacisoli]QYJ05298.1 ABC transporter permease [Nocardioides panacisoli]
MTDPDPLVEHVETPDRAATRAAEDAPTGSLAPRLLDYWLIVHRRTWRGTVLSSLLSPLLYVVAMGVVLGGFIEDDPARLEGAASYLAFVAPGLLSAQVMITAFGEMAWPVMGAVKWARTYEAMLASPLRVRDVVHGHLAFALSRIVLVSVVFTAVLVPFGVFATWWAPFAIIAAQVPLGLAFCAAVHAYTLTMLSESGMMLLFRVGMLPMFLFSGAFFPVANLPTVLEWLARVTPLWHGVDLTRMLAIGEVDVGLAFLHLSYLCAMAAAGVWIATRALERRMRT